MPTPYETFAKTMDRVDGLLALHPQLHGVRGRPAQHVSDVLRGALVLAVAALDALVLQSVIGAVPDAARRQQLGPSVAKWVKVSPESLLAGLGEEDPTAALVAICEKNLGAVTFQRVQAIEGVMRDVVRCAPPWSAAAEILSQADEQWDAERVRERLEEFVSRRHRIAHSGDLRPDGTATRPIQLPYVQEAAEVILAVGIGIDTEIRNLGGH